MTDNFQAMMSDFLKSAQKMSDAFKQANPQGAVDHARTVEGKAGAGDLTATAQVNLKLVVQSVKVNPALLQQDSAMVEEIITAAVNDGLAKAQQTVQQEMLKLTKNMGMPQGA